MEIKSNINKISGNFGNFMKINNYANFKLLKCYKILFSKEGLKSNIGSYILLSIILITIINNALFIKKGYKSLLYIIDKIFYFKENKKISKINLQKKKKKKV